MIKPTQSKKKPQSKKHLKITQSLNQSRINTFDQYYQEVINKKHH